MLIKANAIPKVMKMIAKVYKKVMMNVFYLTTIIIKQLIAEKSLNLNFKIDFQQRYRLLVNNNWGTY